MIGVERVHEQALSSSSARCLASDGGLDVVLDSLSGALLGWTDLNRPSGGAGKGVADLSHCRAPSRAKYPVVRVMVVSPPR